LAVLREHAVAERIAVFVTDQDPEPAFELGRRLFRDGDWPDGATAIYADLAGFTMPPLTTVSQDGVEMGRRAAELLFQIMEDGRPRAEVGDVVLTPRLIIRGSTAPAPASAVAVRAPGIHRGERGS
jgi:hypothetical protein